MFSAKQYRIVVHLDNFFKDHRREARIFVNKSTNTISDLENHIADIFNIKNFYLTCQSYFLPSAEDVRILQEDEAVWVWPKTAQNCDNSLHCEEKVIEHKRKKFKTNSKNVTDKIETQINGIHKLKQSGVSEDEIESAVIDVETQNQSETCKASITKTESKVETMDTYENNKSNTTSRDNSVGRSSVRSFKVMSSIGVLMDSLRNSEIVSDDSFVNKNRRKRVRKHKRSKPEIPVNEDTEQKTIFTNTSKISNNISPIHLRFNDADPVKSGDKEEIACETEQTALYNYSALKDEDFLKYPVMDNTLPRSGDVISFKILKIGENYNPEISKFIVAKVLSYDATNTAVSLKILYGMSELINPQGKFYIETESNVTEDVKEIQWSGLISPRLLFP